MVELNNATAAMENGVLKGIMLDFWLESVT